MNSCKHCGKETKNPQFCSRSCTAQHNNRTSPKRSPEGACKKCGVAISTSRTYCGDCRQKTEEEARQPPRVWMSERLAFSPHLRGGNLSPQSTIGEYLDCFAQLTSLAPRYLPPGDWRRHCQIIQSFRGFSCYDISVRQVPVAEPPITRLPMALYQWVQRIASRAEGHPLAATMAIETAQILWDHARGCRVYDWDSRGKEFSIEPMVSGLDSLEDRDIADQRLKKTISEREVRHLEVVAQLPDEVQLSAYDRPIDRERDNCIFAWSVAILAKVGAAPIDTTC